MNDVGIQASVVVTWLGILFCVSQSAIFSGLNLAFFSLSRLRLEIERDNGNEAATRVLEIRRDSNFLLATVLWGNVGINTLLALLSNSVMTGLMAFLFSTFLITICGEILPQAYFSRNALRMAALLSPVLRFYQFVLFIIAKPSAMALDAWLGEESIQYMRERDLHQLIHRHIGEEKSQLGAVEGVGALNFLAIDDTPVSLEGETVASESILVLPFEDGRPVFEFVNSGVMDDYHAFVDDVARLGLRWLILVDSQGFPAWTLDSNQFLRAAHQAGKRPVDPFLFCHRPIVVTAADTPLGEVLGHLKENQPAHSDKPIPPKVILLWSEERRIITGSDILGRLFKGIGYFSAPQTGQ